MKLSQLYSNKNFQNIEFNLGTGLNVVLAEVTKPKDRATDSHNLGKTTLIYLLDFLLLKGSDKSDIFKAHQKFFVDHEFYLEILLNSGFYLTIKRCVARDTKICFKRHLNPLQNFVGVEDWDEKDIAFEKAREFLESALDFNVLKDWPYRKSVTYFLRNQYDYQDVFQLSKFGKGKDKDWKPFMFDLLGFDGRLLNQKYDLESDKSSLEKFLESTEKKFAVDADEIDKIRGAIELKKEDKAILEDKVLTFSFYDKERGMTKSLVEDTEEKIASLNSSVYKLEYEYNQIQKSLSDHFVFDLDAVKKIFEEVALYFPENLSKSYEELEEFNRRITEERNTFLKNRLEEVRLKLIECKTQLMSLDSRRMDLLRALRSSETFDKFKVYQRDLTKIEVEITRLEEKEKNIDVMKGIKKNIDELSEKIHLLTLEIESQIVQNKSSLYPEVRKHFRHIFKDIVNLPAYIYIKQNSAGNVDFEEVVQNNDDSDLTAANKGTTYKKFLCMAFDLAILASYKDKSFFRFVYHDGALEGLDDRKKINFLELARKFSAENNIQYIFSSIEHDLPNDESGNRVTFADNELVLKLSDAGDEGKLFKTSF